MIKSKLMLARVSHVINTVWYLQILSSLAFISFFLASANIRTQFIAMLPVDFSQLNVRQIRSANSHFDDVRLDSYSGTMVFHFESNWKNVMIMAAGYILLICLLLLITYQVKQIFLNFKKHQHFSKTNVNRLRIIAAIITVVPFLQLSFSLVINAILNANLKLGPFINLSPSFNYGLLITGLFLFAVIQIFKIGIELEEENKMTV